MIILPEELHLLRTMQPVDRDVFYYLAERMDVKTGITGNTRKISHGGIAYDLTEHDGERRCKSTLQILNGRMVRNSITRLIDEGLIKPLSNKGKGNELKLLRVFYVDFLGLGNCDKKADGKLLASQMAYEINFFYQQINKIEEESETRWQAKTKPDGITSFTSSSSGADVEIQMTLDWNPSEDVVKKIIARSNLDYEKITPAWSMSFIAYWSGENRKLSQHKWSIKYACEMADYLRKPGLFEKRRGYDKFESKPAAGMQGNKNKQPDWAIIPRFDEDLGPWLRRHGYDARVGESNWQLRSRLGREIEKKLDDLHSGNSSCGIDAVTKPAWSNIPEDDAGLLKFIKDHNLGTFIPGEPIDKTRNRTKYMVEFRLSNWRGMLR
jgi:hypothetical protein